MATIPELASRGVRKICRKEWNRLAFLEIEIISESMVGPWAKLHDPAVLGEETKDIPVVFISCDDYLEYEPPLDTRPDRE